VQALKKHKASTLLGSAVGKALAAGTLKQGAAVIDWEVQALQREAAQATEQADALKAVLVSNILQLLCLEVLIPPP
jgi:hypothetical protein